MFFIIAQTLASFPSFFLIILDLTYFKCSQLSENMQSLLHVINWELTHVHKRKIHATPQAELLSLILVRESHQNWVLNPLHIWPWVCLSTQKSSSHDWQQWHWLFPDVLFKPIDCGHSKQIASITVCLIIIAMLETNQMRSIQNNALRFLMIWGKKTEIGQWQYLRICTEKKRILTY